MEHARQRNGQGAPQHAPDGFIDHIETEAPVCPYCGRALDLADLPDAIAESDFFYFQCPGCGEHVYTTIARRPVYTTDKTSDEPGMPPVIDWGREA